MKEDLFEAVSQAPAKRKPHAAFIDRTGHRYGRLTVISRAPNRGSAATWNCQCDCGALKTLAGIVLSQGKTVSCGCYAREQTAKRSTKHGQGYGTPAYQTWNGMKGRCLNPSDPAWKHYGGRGINVCQRWKDSFSDFIADMGERPEDKTIDRKDNDGHYSCGKCDECKSNGWKANCRWATPLEQGANQRTNKKLTVNGETHHVLEWSRITGISYNVIFARLRLGWSDERAVLTPVRFRTHPPL